MEKNSLQIKDLKEIKITVDPAEISFLSYDEILQAAREFSQFVGSLVVTEEGLKEAKQGAALIRKQIALVESERKKIKNEVLRPYQEFEGQIKEIVEIINDADNHLRDQIRHFENQERLNKYSLIEQLWDKRNMIYKFEHFDFCDFVEERHLNKTVTMKKIEEEMVGWFEKIKGDLASIDLLPDSQEILNEYYETLDLSQSIQIVSERKRKKNIQSIQTQKSENEFSHTLKIFAKSKDEIFKIIEILDQESLGCHYEIQ